MGIARFILSFSLLLSGLVKAVDPIGGSYKIAEYLSHFGLDIFLIGRLPLVESIVQSTLEFTLGALLLWGIRRRIVSCLVFLLFLFFTFLTLYIALYHPVSDCGCFGDYLHLSNWETFYKNLVLFACSLLLLFHPGRLTKFVGHHLGWLISLFSLTYVFVIAVYSVYNLPIIDFRQYRIGTDIQKNVYGDSLSNSYVYTLEKNGEKREFTDRDYPDSTWTFVSAKTVTDRNNPTLFSAYDFQSDLDVTQTILEDTCYSFWIILSNVEDMDESAIDAIDALQDYCNTYNYPILFLTSSNKQAITTWQKNEDITVPCFQTDEAVLKEMIRSNPGFLLLKNGTIINKWSANNFPDEDTLIAPCEKLPFSHIHPESAEKKLLFLALLYFIPILLLVLIGHRPKKKTNSKNKKTMRKKIVAGNWKMNMNLQDGIALAKELNIMLQEDRPACGVVICTPFIHLASIAQFLDKDIIGLGAENCADKEKGAYTGEVSAEMIRSTGADHVILGHSERRGYYAETPDILKEKVLLALKNNLKVIFCIGESLEERESNKQNEIVKAELEGSVFNLDAEDFKKIIIAYEPIWAIGTGKTATAEQAEEIHAYIRSIIAERYGKEIAENTSILYGGSCKPSNARELFAKPDIDGGLIGGASLKSADFKGIIDAWK